MLNPRARILFLGLLSLAVILGCRAADTLTGVGGVQTTIVPSTPTSMAIAASTLAPEVTPTPIVTPSDTPTPSPIPTNTPTLPPTQPPPTATSTRRPSATPTFTITPTPSPTRCPYKYCIVIPKTCISDQDTVIEGTVYANGKPENGVIVRAAIREGGGPRLDFVTGTQAMNPGVPDPDHPGHYFLQLVAGAAQDGFWYVFIVDKPSESGAKQISQSIQIHTEGARTATSCQHAFVDFVR